MRCAEVYSPNVQKIQLELRRAQAEVTAAGQWKNPEFSVNSVQGNLGPEEGEQTDLALAIPIELGGKISARKASAQAEVTRVEARLLEAQIEARNEALLRLHRYRQLQHEMEVIDESIKTFGKLVAQYSSRPKLAPEQEMTLTVFRLAKSDYELKRVDVNDEITSIETYFKISFRLSRRSSSARVPLSYVLLENSYVHRFPCGPPAGWNFVRICGRILPTRFLVHVDRSVRRDPFAGGSENPTRTQAREG